jgi:GTPase
VVSDADYIPKQILAQARMALEQAAQVIFVVDGRSEITASDRELAAMLRKVGKPVSLVVDKCDTGAKEDLIHDFYSLGIKDILPVSTEQGMGMDALLDLVTKDFPHKIAAALHAA